MARMAARRLAAGAAPRPRPSGARSIQARVVVSTLLLSARRGQRRRLVPAPADPRRPARPPGRGRRRRGRRRDRRGRATGSSRARHRHRRRAPAARPGRPDHPARRHPRLRAWCSPARSARTAGSPTAAPSSPPGLDTSSVPRVAGGALRRRAADRRGPTPTIRSTDGRRPTAEQPGIVVGSQVPLPADGETYTLYYLFPLDERAGDPGAGHPRAAHRRRSLLLVLVAGITWLVTRQVVTPIRMARRVAERLAAGQLQERLRVPRRGRPGPAGHLVQPDGHQPAAPDPPARGAQPGPAPVRLRRLPRAAHAADHGADGRRRAPRRARPASTRPPARAAELLQTELDRFETLLADLLEISRFDAGAAVLDLDDVEPRRRRAPGRRRDPALADQRGTRGRGRTRRTSPASPRPTYAGSSGSCATWSPTRSTTPTAAPTSWSHVRRRRPRRRDRGPRLRGRAWRPGRPRWCSTGSGAPTPPGPAPAAAPASGLSISLEDAHLHGGWLQAWGRPGEGAQFRLTLPRRVGGAAAPEPAARWCPPTPS